MGFSLSKGLSPLRLSLKAGFSSMQVAILSQCILRLSLEGFSSLPLAISICPSKHVHQGFALSGLSPFSSQGFSLLQGLSLSFEILSNPTLVVVAHMHVWRRGSSLIQGHSLEMSFFLWTSSFPESILLPSGIGGWRWRHLDVRFFFLAVLQSTF